MLKYEAGDIVEGAKTHIIYVVLNLLECGYVGTDVHCKECNFKLLRCMIINPPEHLQDLGHWHRELFDQVEVCPFYAVKKEVDEGNCITSQD